MELEVHSEPESESGPILSTVWALIMPPSDVSPEENWAIATSDEKGFDWFWWELVKLDTGGFASQRNVSDEASQRASQIYLGEISRLDAIEMGQNMPLEVANRPESWTSRKFVFAIWCTLYQDGVLNKHEYEFGTQELLTGTQK